MPGSVADLAALRERLAGDPHRPRYHLTAPAAWMNDPNGPLYWRGEFHLFYQYAPAWPDDDTKHWGHAVSSDLAHWRDLPVAISPTPGGPDKDGIYTGSAAVHEGRPFVMYTGVHPEVQCLALGSDDMVTWEKHPANPVIPGPPEGPAVTGFRDPCIWQAGGVWQMLIGSGITDVGGTALLYRSPDLITWEYVGPFHTGAVAETGGMWECPDFFALGDSHVLLVSTLATTLYMTGEYTSDAFTPRVLGNTDYGGAFYAAKTLEDDRGRRIVWGWAWEDRSAEAQAAAGWAGVMSLPRLLSLAPDGTLRFAPVPELESLRGREHSSCGLALEPGERRMLDVVGDCLELIATVRAYAGARVGIGLRCTPDGAEQTWVVYDADRGVLCIDRSRSTLSDDVQRTERSCALPLGDGEEVSLRIFLDRSILEVFANDRCCLTTRVYPSRPDSLGVALRAEGGKAEFGELRVWELRAI
jgi:beta-fructofuranosidase